MTEYFYVIRDRGAAIFVADDETSLVPFNLAVHFISPDDVAFTACAEALPQARLHWVGPCEQNTVKSPVSRKNEKVNSIVYRVGRCIGADVHFDGQCEKNERLPKLWVLQKWQEGT